MALQFSADTSGLSTAVLEADVLAAVYKSILPSRAYTVDLRGRHSVQIPVYSPFSKSSTTANEAVAITPSDPTFTGATMTLSSKAVSATRCSAEFMQDGENTSFRKAIVGIITESLHRQLEIAAYTELWIGAIASRDVAAGSPPSDGDWDAAMGLVSPAAYGPNTACYVSPQNWPGMASHCSYESLPAGAVGRYKGFPVFLVKEFPVASTCMGVFGDLSRGLGLALGELSVRVMDQPHAATDEVLVQGTLRFGVKTLDSGCISTLSAV